ncbi:MAG TPA: hypothetical protein VI197_01975 [Polyangiaceae bacterium]
MNVAVEEHEAGPADHPVGQIGQITAEERLRAALPTQQARDHTQQVPDIET